VYDVRIDDHTQQSHAKFEQLRSMSSALRHMTWDQFLSLPDKADEPALADLCKRCNDSALTADLLRLHKECKGLRQHVALGGAALYDYGKETSSCVLILSGRVKLLAGREGFASFKSRWAFLCPHLITVTQSDWEAAPESILNAPSWQADFSASVVDYARVLIFRRSKYLELLAEEQPRSCRQYFVNRHPEIDEKKISACRAELAELQLKQREELSAFRKNWESLLKEAKCDQPELLGTHVLQQTRSPEQNMDEKIEKKEKNRQEFIDKLLISSKTDTSPAVPPAGSKIISAAVSISSDDDEKVKTQKQVRIDGQIDRWTEC
jgi:hypothetical protein